jgi:uncharacterized protein YjiS (DUF1127 family)
MSANLFLTLIRRMQVRSHLRRSMGDLLVRSDDHLLADIGLTRHQAERLIADPPTDVISPDGPQPMQTAKAAMACRA